MSLKAKSLFANPYMLCRWLRDTHRDCFRHALASFGFRASKVVRSLFALGVIRSTNGTKINLMRKCHRLSIRVCCLTSDALVCSILSHWLNASQSLRLASFRLRNCRHGLAVRRRPADCRDGRMVATSGHDRRVTDGMVDSAFDHLPIPGS